MPRTREMIEAVRSIETIRDFLLQMKTLDVFSSNDRDQIGEAAGCLQNVMNSCGMRVHLKRRIHRHRILDFILGSHPQ